MNCISKMMDRQFISCTLIYRLLPRIQVNMYIKVRRLHYSCHACFDMLSLCYFQAVCQASYRLVKQLEIFHCYLCKTLSCDNSEITK